MRGSKCNVTRLVRNAETGSIPIQSHPSNFGAYQQRLHLFRRVLFRPYRDEERFVAELKSKACTTLDQLIRSKARQDSLALKRGLLANWKKAMAGAVASAIPARGVSEGQSATKRATKTPRCDALKKLIPR